MDIGSRLELFVDDALIDRRKKVALKMHPPQPQNVALQFEKPWEGPVSGYVAVLEDGGKYRMYYRGSRSRKDSVGEATCLAESDDGIEWQRLELGLFEHSGSKRNNIIWTGPGAHNFSPFVDARPDCPPDERYKAFAREKGGLVALVSADGIRWRRLLEEPVLTQGAFDSQNVAMWDSLRGQYVAFFRVFSDPRTGKMSHERSDGEVFTGIRSIARALSDDFVNWSETVEFDYGDSPREHLYTNAIVAYPRAPHIYVGFPKRFMPTRKANPEHPAVGLSDGVFISSRDGLHWDRRFMEAFLRPGRDPGNWGDRSNGIAHGMLQTAPDELSLYYGEHYRTESVRLRRTTVRTDGFVSVNAPYSGGEFTTVPLQFKGRRLLLNYATSAAGSVRVEMRDEDDRPIEGHALRDCPEIYGDEIERTVSWKGGPDVSRLEGRPVRLRFVMKDADLYSLRFQQV